MSYIKLSWVCFEIYSLIVPEAWVSVYGKHCFVMATRRPTKLALLFVNFKKKVWNINKRFWFNLLFKDNAMIKIFILVGSHKSDNCIENLSQWACQDFKQMKIRTDRKKSGKHSLYCPVLPFCRKSNYCSKQSYVIWYSFR